MRVPAIVVSPLIPRGIIDHSVYDHTSVLATVEHIFGLLPLTERDKQAHSLNHLFSLATPRTDAPPLLYLNLPVLGYRVKTRRKNVLQRGNWLTPPEPIHTGVFARDFLKRCARIFSNRERATYCELFEHKHPSRCNTLFGGCSPEDRASKGRVNTKWRVRGMATHNETGHLLQGQRFDGHFRVD